MSDLIDRQAAIDVIINCADLQEAKSCLIALPPVKPEQKWIPCCERLPGKNMACLVSVGEFNLTQMAIYSDLMETIDHRIFYQEDYGHDSFSDITEYVKAWMPLPEPYKMEVTNGRTL